MGKNKSKHISPAQTFNEYQRRMRTNSYAQADAMNSAQYMFYYDWLLQLSCARFEWQGLPKELDRRFLELTLNLNGLSVFFFDEEYEKFFACEATPNGRINMYRNPTRYTAYGTGGFLRKLTMDECVPIWNNFTRTPSIMAIEIYARRLAEIDRTIDVNLANQKHPVFVTCNEEQRLTVENILKQVYEGQPVVIGDKLSLNGVDIGYISSEVPYIVDKLIKDKATIWCEIMSWLGIDNTSVEKPERVQTAEVNANNEQISKSGLISLDMRRYSCEDINRRFHLETWVDMATDWSSMNYAYIMAAPALNRGAENDI